jgi:hypothetical protein
VLSAAVKREVRTFPDGLQLVPRKLSNGTGWLLVVVDQLEELFRLTPESDRRPFLRTLRGALGNAPFTLVLALRADFYGQMIALDPELSDRFPSAQLNVGGMTRDELRESITLPADWAGLQMEAGLVDRILADVDSEPGRLPLVEFTLTELWNGREGHRLTNRAYTKMGGVAGSLASRAEFEFRELTEEGQKAARRLFSRIW